MCSTHSSITGSLLSSWCSFPGLKHPLHRGNSRWPHPTLVLEGASRELPLPRILTFSGPAAAGLWDQHRLGKKFSIWSLGNSGYREWRHCQEVLQRVCLCCRYAWSLHNSFVLLLGSTIFCCATCEALQQCAFMSIRQCIRSPWQWLCSLRHQWISLLIRPGPEQELALVTFFFPSLLKFIIKKNPKQPEKFNVVSKMYLLLFFPPVVIKS